MSGRSPSSGLEAIMGIMESEVEQIGDGHIFDSIHFNSTQLHGHFEPHEDLSRSIGLPEKGSEFFLSSPLITTKGLMEKLTPNAQLGIALGQAIAGLPVNIYHGMPPEMEEMIGSYKPRTIYCYGPHRQDFDLDRLRRADIIQVELMDRSNDPPIHLPEIRKGKDVIQLAELLNELRNAPLIYDISCNNIVKDLDFILISKIDAVLIDCSPYPLERRPDVIMLTSLIHANRQMEVFNSRNKGMKIIMNGPVRDVSDIIKIMALGADIVGIDHLTLSFLRSYLSFKTGEKYITNDDLAEPRDELDWAEIGELYSEYIALLIDGLKDGLHYLNIDPSKGIDISDIETSDYSTASISGIPLQGFGQPVPFWRHRS